MFAFKFDVYVDYGRLFYNRKRLFESKPKIKTNI